MKLSDAIEKACNKYWLSASLRKNPSLPTQWFVMLIDKNQRLHMLVDDDENPIINHDLNHFIDVLKSIGIREFTVYM